MSAPGYWMNETGGELTPAVKRYLEGRKLRPREVRLMQLYLQQWIDSPVWEENPHQDSESRQELERLRTWARHLTNRLAISAWIAAAMDIGIDPL